jgi:hypothetical protein
VASTESKFRSMLDTDAKTFKNLVTSKAIIREYKKHTAAYRKGDRSIWPGNTEFNRFIGDFNKQITAFNSTVNSYVKRQRDYRAKPSLFEKTKDKVVRAFHSFYAKIAGAAGLGAAPVLLAAIPLIVKASAVVLSITVIAAFVSKYFRSTKVDFDESLQQISELAEINPDLAKKALDAVKELQSKQSSSVAGKVIAVVGLTAGGVIVYGIGKEKGWWGK